MDDCAAKIYNKKIDMNKYAEFYNEKTNKYIKLLEDFELDLNLRSKRLDDVQKNYASMDVDIKSQYENIYFIQSKFEEKRAELKKEEQNILNSKFSLDVKSTNIIQRESAIEKREEKLNADIILMENQRSKLQYLEKEVWNRETTFIVEKEALIKGVSLIANGEIKDRAVLRSNPEFSRASELLEKVFDCFENWRKNFSKKFQDLKTQEEVAMEKASAAKLAEQAALASQNVALRMKADYDAAYLKLPAIAAALDIREKALEARLANIGKDLKLIERMAKLVRQYAPSFGTEARELLPRIDHSVKRAATALASLFGIGQGQDGPGR